MFSAAIATPNGLRTRGFEDIPKFDGKPRRFREYVGDHEIPIELVDQLSFAESGPYSMIGGALAQPYTLRASEKAPQLIIPNRLAIHPMEGWDGNLDGSVSEEVKRRWLNFAKSGAGLVWFEAMAVRHDGRANPNQLVLNEENFNGFKKLIDEFKHEFSLYHIGAQKPVIGFQLTHSGRFASPNKHNSLEQSILYDSKVLRQSPDAKIMTDGDIDQLINDFVKSAKLAQKAGVDFVDIKHCHGYLGHEFLSAVNRPGKYGGDFEGRTKFLREVVRRIREEAPGLHIGVRLSAFDFAPFVDNGALLGKPTDLNGQFLFGNDGTSQGIDLTETIKFLDLLESLNIQMVNVTAGSPYYNSYMQRPTHTPPKGAVYTPVDPIAMMALHMEVTAALKKAKPNMFFIGSGYSYAQEFFPHIAESNVQRGKVDAVGYGRLAIPYPTAAADALNGMYGEKIDPTSFSEADAGVRQYYERMDAALKAKTTDRGICRAVGTCTNNPRNGKGSVCPIQTALKDSRAFLDMQEIRKAGGQMPKQLEQLLDYAKLEPLLIKQGRTLDAAVFRELGLDYIPGLITS
jgi:2,4-dienoyl-CoA reductase-like NADH-dependent reductase (Old Yellow Enzyme family)